MKILAAVALTAFAGLAVMWQPGEEPASATGVRGFQSVSMSTCTDWRQAKIGERLRLLTEMGDHFGHESHVWSGATLPMDEARRVMETACSQPEARNIKLYKLYVRALSFGR